MDRPDRDYEADRACKLACMAEALSPVAVPASHFHAVYVATEESDGQVRAQMKLAGIQCYVTLNKGMFPSGAK